MGTDNLKLTIGSVNKELIDKIKFDASRPVPPFLSKNENSSQKPSKVSTRSKVVTKARQVKAPK